jgi:phosphohistidine phosphatase
MSARRRPASLALSLVRHAKSSWDDATLPDHERPLAPRGIKAATRMSSYLADEDLVPDLVLSSDSVRTRATCALLFAPLDVPAPPVVTTRDLYLADADAILEVVRREGAAHTQARHIMVIGHNPGLQLLALSLPGNAARPDIEQLAVKFPTAALAHFIFEAGDWSQIAPGRARLERFIVPKALKG